MSIEAALAKLTLAIEAQTALTLSLVSTAIDKSAITTHDGVDTDTDTDTDGDGDTNFVAVDAPVESLEAFADDTETETDTLTVEGVRQMTKDRAAQGVSRKKMKALLVKAGAETIDDLTPAKLKKFANAVRRLR